MRSVFIARGGYAALGGHNVVYSNQLLKLKGVSEVL